MKCSLEEAAALIQSGQVIAYPTETFWGLAALPSSKEGIDRLVVLKQRTPEKGFSLIVSNATVAEEFAGFVDDASLKACRKLVADHWPGPLTIVVSPSVVARNAFNPRVFAPDGSLALRVSSLENARKLAELVGGAITATSANPANLAPASSIAEVMQYYPDLTICDFNMTGELSDATSAKKQLASTILDIRTFPFSVLRQGAVLV